MTKIADIKSREILDSRGNPTLETAVFIDNGLTGIYSVPSGASTGKHEAMELRDEDNTRFHGKGVRKAIRIIEDRIKPLLVNKDILNQQGIDKLMIEADGTENKSNFGANSILSVSCACARTASLSLNIPLYQYINSLSQAKKIYSNVIPMFNIINGGMHGSSANLTIQEFLLIPHLNAIFAQRLRIGVEIYQILKKIITGMKLSAGIGDEGGFTPAFSSNDEAIGAIIKAVNQSGLNYNSQVSIGLDLAATTYFNQGKYRDLNTVNNFIPADDYLVKLEVLRTKYKLFSLEDPLSEDDWINWTKLTSDTGKTTLIIGDDLLVTNIKRLNKAIEKKACNAILIKPNQIGTLSETLQVIRQAKEVNFKIIISHRSGETCDDFIADLAVGVNADFIKFGAPARGERVAKYNRLLAIYSQLV